MRLDSPAATETLRHGIPNERTEALLQRFRPRRAQHRFCNPGYCRCFVASTQDDYAPSRLQGTAPVRMLESTGEGVHVYDFAHRMFESGFLVSSIRAVDSAASISAPQKPGGIAPAICRSSPVTASSATSSAATSKFDASL